MTTTPNKELLDKGFDADFSQARLDQLCSLAGNEDALQEYINRIHEEDNTLDMKRGEFYPEILRGVSSLKHAVAKAYKIDFRQVHTNFGSNCSIDTILMAMKMREIKRGIDPEHAGGMLVATPTYFRNYNSCSSKRMRIIKVPLLEPDWTFDPDAMIAALGEQKPTVVFLVTPNNPTGTALPDSDIRRFISAVPDDTAVVMDRTLANIDVEAATLDLLHEFGHKQVLILHSFSKYAGLSHLRVGLMIYSNLALAEEVWPLLPLGLTLEASAKANTLINKYGVLRPSKKVLDNIRKNKAILENFCGTGKGFSCSDFSGNYCVLCLDNGCQVSN